MKPLNIKSVLVSLGLGLGAARRLVSSGSTCGLLWLLRLAPRRGGAVR